MRKAYDFTSSRPNPFASRLKRTVTIRLNERRSPTFGSWRRNRIGYQTLINSHLKDCAATGRRPSVRHLLRRTTVADF
jgi:hypothetical protein